MKKLRVLQIFTQPWKIGGAETHLQTLLSSLRAQNCELVLTGTDEKLGSIFPDVPVYQLPFRSISSLFLNFHRLQKIITEHQISVIHVHQRTGCVYGFLLERSLKIPYTCTFHDKWNSTNIIYKPFLPKQMISISEGVKSHFIDTYHLNPQDIRIIPNGIDISHFFINNYQDSISKLIHISRFTGRKGQIALLLCRAIELLNPHFPNIFLTLVGQGSMEALIRNQVERTNEICGRKAVSFLGPRDDIPDLLSQSSVVIGAGRVALEAMAAGKPVIAIADGDDFPGLIEESNWQDASRTSWTRGSKRICLDGLVAEITRILRDIGLQQKLQVFGKELVKKYFNSEIMAKKVIEIYYGLFVPQS